MLEDNETAARPGRRTKEGPTVADSSFDIVSKLDRQEIDNAVNQAVKEVGQRYDFRNTGASLTLGGDEIVMTANAEERVLAVLDVLQSKLRSEEHTSELQSRFDLVCRLLLE